MADKLMYIPNLDAQSYPFCWLQLVVETFGHWTWKSKKSKFNKDPKVVEPTNKNMSS